MQSLNVIKVDKFFQLYQTLKKEKSCSLKKRRIFYFDLAITKSESGHVSRHLNSNEFRNFSRSHREWSDISSDNPLAFGFEDLSFTQLLEMAAEIVLNLTTVCVIVNIELYLKNQIIIPR